MTYEVAIRARNLLWGYPLGGAEKVVYNWISRFRKINVHMVPVVDDIYAKMCFSGRARKEEVEEAVRRQPFHYEDDVLNLYLDCKLHLNLDVYNKLDYNYVFDPVLFPDTLPLRKQLIEREGSSPFILSMLRKGSLLISTLIGIGDIDLTYSYLLNAPHMYYGGLNDNLFLKYLYLRSIERHLLISLRRYKNRVVFLSTSKGVMEKLPTLGSEVEMIFPHFALDEDVRKYKVSEGEKEDYAVFFARVTALKGIYEAIKAFRYLKDKGVKSLLVIGENFSSARPEEGVQFLGRVKEQHEVYKTISHARVSIYPSHTDTFGISVLETLGVGTPVSMYYNPANYEFFSRSKIVKVAKEYDVKELARNALRLKYTEDEYTDSLLRLHLSWEKVAGKVEDIIVKWIDIKDHL